MTTFKRLHFQPDLLAVHHAEPDRWPFLLASTAGTEKLGRWSLLLHASGEPPIIKSPGPDSIRFLDQLEKAWQAARQPAAQTGLPFNGGWFIFLGYELAGEIEPHLDLPEAPDGLPVAFAQRCPAALLMDHQLGVMWLVAESETQFAQLQDRLQAAALPSLEDRGEELELELYPAAGEEFTAGVRRIREYILDGDVFQVNLSRRWLGASSRPLSPALLYGRLCTSNAAPFAGMARLPGATVLSSSPERLVECRGGVVQTRPIAGTRPRGASADLDRSLSAELITHPKERAEHIMLIDLERNDLGRVCETGSVEVDELMVVESYAHVHHIVSNIRGRLRPEASPVDVIRAVFPGGTITGCPKVRCMEIIADLERKGRGFYTGSMGYLGTDGSMDLNILIRSMQVAGSRLSFHTGAGIVADSDPQAELAETRAKALGLLKALGHG